MPRKLGAFYPANGAESAALLEGMLTNAPVGISFFDSELRFIRINQFFSLRNELKPEDHLGKTLRELFHDMDPVGTEKAEALLRQVLESGEPISELELLICRRSGQRHYLANYYPLRDAEGSVQGVGSILIDITERKEAEERAKTLATENERLYLEAQAANQMKDEFLSTVSHELKTPLNVIVGWADLLRLSTIDARHMKEGLDAIARNGKIQTGLVNDLLDVSRIISGKLRVAIAPVDLLVPLRAAIESIGLTAEAKQLKVALESGVERAVVLGDESRLQQVFWNLLSNAVKFTPRDRGEIKVRLFEEEAQIAVEVSDRGIGIEASFLPHVFDLFRQQESLSSRAHRGLGAGLSIVKQLVELHGGTIRAASDGLNQGSTFTAYFPRPQAGLDIA